MFSRSLHSHEHTCRLLRLTIVMTISIHHQSLDITRIQEYLNWSIPISFTYTYSLCLFHHSDCQTFIKTHHLVCPAITSSSSINTHTLIIITYLHTLITILSHPGVSLLAYSWCSCISGHISIQRIKTINKSIALTRSLCLSTVMI